MIPSTCAMKRRFIQKIGAGAILLAIAPLTGTVQGSPAQATELTPRLPLRTTQTVKRPQPIPPTPKKSGSGTASKAIETKTFKRPQPAPDTPRKLGAGTANRGTCLVTGSQTTEPITLTPLVPPENWGFTLSESPTIWFYLQYPPDPAVPPISATLALEERATNTKLLPKSYPIQLPRKSGVFGLSLPYTLQSNQWYRWYLSLDCQSIAGSNAVLELLGFLYRPSLPGIEHSLDSKTALERLQIYADRGIWYDALTAAARYHCQHFPGQVLEENHPLSRLLRDDDVKLHHIASRPVICPG